MTRKDSSVKIPDNPHIQQIRNAVESVYKDFNLDPVCTSGNDGTHGPRSLHYQDRALDIRFWDVLNVVASRIREHLPPSFDVVIEKDHFHIEADPKKEKG